jgi:hypothetical protein
MYCFIYSIFLKDNYLFGNIGQETNKDISIYNNIYADSLELLLT